MGKRIDRKVRAVLRRVFLVTALIAGQTAAGMMTHEDVKAAERLSGKDGQAAEGSSGVDGQAASASSAGGLADGRYAVDVVLSGGSGKASVESPTLLEVKDGKYFAQIIWSSSNYDYMIVEGETYYNENEDGGNSMFQIPVLAFDEEMPVIADTVAMGAPHEIQYTLHFYSDSVGSESSLPREGAKRVLIMAACIIVAGGILNYFTNKRRKRDYSGAGR